MYVYIIIYIYILGNDGKLWDLGNNIPLMGNIPLVCVECKAKGSALSIPQGSCWKLPSFRKLPMKHSVQLQQVDQRFLNLP